MIQFRQGSTYFVTRLALQFTYIKNYFGHDVVIPIILRIVRHDQNNWKAMCT